MKKDKTKTKIIICPNCNGMGKTYTDERISANESIKSDI
jgi:hypothetical protein